MTIPVGDILIHCGDFTQTDKLCEVADFSDWLSSLPHKHKIVIAGNHETPFQSDFYESRWKRFHRRKEDSTAVRASLKNCTYLENSSVTVEGIKIFGSPWQPRYFDWAFNVQRGSEIRCKWERIPRDVDILVTHGPPVGYGDNGHDMEPPRGYRREDTSHVHNLT